MTQLQEQVEQLSRLLTDKIAREIADGAEVKHWTRTMVEVEGVTIHKTSGDAFVTIKLQSKEIDELFEPSRDELSRRKMELQNELNQINLKLKEQ